MTPRTNITRPVLIAALFLLLASSSASAGFGSFPYTTSKVTDTLTGQFRIGLVNTGNRTRTVELTASTPTNATVSFEHPQLRLPPSEMTSDPSSSGWLHLGDGRYAKPHDITATISIPSSAGRRVHNATVTLRALPGDSGQESGLSQTAIHVTQHRLRLRTRSQKISPGFSRTETPEYDAAWEITGDGDADSNTSSTADSGSSPPRQDTERQTAGEETNKTSARPDTTRETGPPITALLATGIVVTGLYILRQLLQ